jgi:RNA polymerase sigma-70 factor (ECF subfamily)
MLSEDATWSMPPIPTWFSGVQSVREWLVRDPLTERWRHRPARANGQLAVGCYLYDAGRGSYRPAVIDVLALEGGRIAAVTGFLAPDVEPPGRAAAPVTGAQMFARFGLPAEVT